MGKRGSGDSDIFGKAIVRAVLAATVSALAVGASADVFNMGPGLTSLETVPVRNPGNTGERSGYSYENLICGAVGYIYNIGKYEITVGQYTEFLNAVAGVDTYNLYSLEMPGGTSGRGCGISRTGDGTLGNPYTYIVDAGFVNRPVCYVSYGDAMRFANWLHNGQPIGTQNASTTEDGAYFVNGAMSRDELLAVNRKSNWKWAITSEDEWYKAAYYNPLTNTYFDYPTSSNTIPGRDMADVSGNNMNYEDSGWPYPNPIDPPYYTTLAGEFQASESPYGTFDQGGNLWEWNESIPYGGSARGMRGGAFVNAAERARAADHSGAGPEYETFYDGFRVASIPEPGSIAMLLGGAVAALLWWKRRK